MFFCFAMSDEDEMSAVFSGLGKDAPAEAPGPRRARELGAGQAPGLMGPSGMYVMGAAQPPGLAGTRSVIGGMRVTGAAQPPGLAGTRSVRSAGAALGGRNSPAGENVSVAIQIDPEEQGDHTGFQQQEWMAQSVGAAQRQASGPSSGPSGEDPVVGNRAQGFDMSAIAGDLFEEFQMFKLFLEVRRRGEMPIEAPDDLPTSSVQANPTTSVQTHAHYQGVNVLDEVRAEDSQTPQTFGSLQATGQVAPHIQTLVPSLLAPGQQSDARVSVAQVPTVARQTMSPQTLTVSTQNAMGQHSGIQAQEQQADSRQVRLGPVPTVQFQLLPSAILSPPQQTGPFPVHLGRGSKMNSVPVTSSPLRVEMSPEFPTPAMAAPAPGPTPVSALPPSRAVDPYVAILEKQGQILEKLADSSRSTAVKPVVPKPPEQYKLKADIRSWLSQFDTYLSITRVEDANKAQYLLTNLSSEAYEQVSKAQWPQTL